MQYDVFISYSRKDSEVANRICKAFDEAGITYFIDLQGINGGFEFPTVLAEAIINSKIFLYLASRNSYESKFTQAEITFAFNKKERGNILPYIIDRSDLPLSLELVFSAINWRRLEEHPVETVLIDDLLHLLNKKREQRGERQTTLYMVRLASAGAAKLQVVKVVKESLGIGLKEAKDLVDNAPCELPNTYSFEEASLLKNVLEDIGATAVLLSSTMGTLPSSAQCYLELQSASPFNKDFLTRYTSFSAQEISAYISSVPCILPYLYDTSVAAGLKASLEREGAKVRLIPYDENSRSVGFKILTTGTAKLQVVKCLKELLEIDLKRAKELADAAPAVVATTQDMKEALWFADGLREAGAVVSVVLQ